MTRILVDVDGHSMVGEVVHLRGCFEVGCLILCDTSYHFEKVGARTLAVSEGADSVDSTLVNLLWPGDIVVTQDYGLVAMCVARGARILNQDGMEYTTQDIGTLSPARHTAKKIRNAGGRLKGSHKRLPEQDQVLCGKLARPLGEE